MDHDLGGVEELLHPEPIAARAGPRRVVEREEPGLELGDAVAADGAGEVGGEGELRGSCLAPLLLGRHIDGGDPGDAAGERQGGLEGLCQAQGKVRAHPEAVHHHLDVVALLLVQLGGRVQLHDGPVDAGAHEALGVQLGDQALVLPLAGRDHRGQQHEPLPLGQGQHLVHHLGDRLGLQGLTVLGTAGGPHPGEQEPQIVVDLGDGADGGAGVVGGGLLLDGDGGGEALDVVHIGLVHHREELPGIGGEGLDVAALPLRVDGVEGQ